MDGNGAHFGVRSATGLLKVLDQGWKTQAGELLLSCEVAGNNTVLSMTKVEKLVIFDRETDAILGQVPVQVFPQVQLVHKPSTVAFRVDSEAKDYLGYGIVLGDGELLNRIPDRGVLRLSGDKEVCGKGQFLVESRTKTVVSLSYHLSKSFVLQEKSPILVFLLDEDGGELLKFKLRIVGEF